MKFGEQLTQQAMSAWKDFYVDYALLKSVIYARTPDTDQAVTNFLAAFNAEVDKVKSFVDDQLHTIASEARSIQELRAQSAPDDAAAAVRARRDWIAAENKQLDVLYRLRQFVELNYTAMYKALKKFDKTRGTSLLHGTMADIDQQSFMRVLHADVLASTTEGIEEAAAMRTRLRRASAHRSVPSGHDSVCSLPELEEEAMPLDMDTPGAVSDVMQRPGAEDRTETAEMSLLRSMSTLDMPAEISMARVFSSMSAGVDPELGPKQEVYKLVLEFLGAARTCYNAGKAVQFMVSPEATDEQEQRRLLAKLMYHIVRLLPQITLLARKGKVADLKATVLSAQLELFRALIKLAARGIEDRSPEVAALLELVVVAHHSVFARKMMSDVGLPSARRMTIVSQMLKRDRPEAAELIDSIRANAAAVEGVRDKSLLYYSAAALGGSSSRSLDQVQVSMEGGQAAPSPSSGGGGGGGGQDSAGNDNTDAGDDDDDDDARSVDTLLEVLETAVDAAPAGRRDMSGIQDFAEQLLLSLLGEEDAPAPHVLVPNLASGSKSSHGSKRGAFARIAASLAEAPAAVTTPAAAALRTSGIGVDVNAREVDQTELVGAADTPEAWQESDAPDRTPAIGQSKLGSSKPGSLLDVMPREAEAARLISVPDVVQEESVSTDRSTSVRTVSTRSDEPDDDSDRSWWSCGPFACACARRRDALVVKAPAGPVDDGESVASFAAAAGSTIGRNTEFMLPKDLMSQSEHQTHGDDDIAWQSMCGGGGGNRCPVCACVVARIAKESITHKLLMALRPQVLDWLPSYEWRQYFKRDLIAAITIAVVVIPQGLAYSLLAGMPPVYGIYTAIMPAIVYAMLGGSAHAAVGPMSIPSLLVAAALSSLSPVPSGERYLALALLITLEVGVIAFIMGLLHVGFIVQFISRPVLAGFASAAALIAGASVVKDLLRVHAAKSTSLLESIINIAKAVPDTHWPSALFGGVCLVALVLLPRWKYTQRLPAPLIVVFVSIAVMATWMLSMDDRGEMTGGALLSEAGLQVVGEVPSDLPSPQLYLPGVMSSLSWSDVVTLLPSAITITFVSFIQNVAVSKGYAVRFGYDLDASSELRALGIANIVGSSFGSLPAMGGFSRSAVNVKSGAKSQLSLFLSGLILLVLVMTITPALFYLPKATLAAVIIVAVASLVDIKGAKRLWKTHKPDLAVQATAFLATALLGVQLGVLIAMGVSLVLFVYTATQARVDELGRVPGTATYKHLGTPGVLPVAGVKVLKFYAPLFFANVGMLRDRLLGELTARASLPPRLRWRAIVLSCATIASIDSTALNTLIEVAAAYEKRGVPLIIAAAISSVETRMTKAGLVTALGGPQMLQRRVHDAVRAVLLNLIGARGDSGMESSEQLSGAVSVSSGMSRRRTNAPGGALASRVL